eukprot:366482-Chlamydomonas_euryale.AAC.2
MMALPFCGLHGGCQKTACACSCRFNLVAKIESGLHGRTGSSSSSVADSSSQLNAHSSTWLARSVPREHA